LRNKKKGDMEANVCPVILLDIDGVVHPLAPSGHPLHASMDDLSARCDADLEMDEEEGVGGVVEGEFTAECMHALQECCQATGCEIVLSSTWRETQPQRRAVDGQLRKANLPASSGCTPRLPLVGGGRAHEILAWAEANPSRCWVAIDDMALDELPEAHFVKTDPAVGLTSADAELVVEKLRQQRVRALGMDTEQDEGRSTPRRRRRGGMQRSMLGISVESDGTMQLQIHVADGGEHIDEVEQATGPTGTGEWRARHATATVVREC
jgi:hypothetical protein